MTHRKQSFFADRRIRSAVHDRMRKLRSDARAGATVQGGNLFGYFRYDYKNVSRPTYDIVKAESKAIVKRLKQDKIIR